jgi:hypothetical protein
MDVKPSDSFGLKFHEFSFGIVITVVTEGEGMLDIESKADGRRQEAEGKNLEGDSNPPPNKCH